jgi:transposase
MRGNQEQQEEVFSYVCLEQRVPQNHPLRRIRSISDQALRELSGLFDQIYARGGRPSIAPERLLRALLLQVLYTIRSERLLMEQLDYNLLFRWFVGLRMDDGVWDVTVFTKNRDRLVNAEVAQRFFEAVLQQAAEAKLLSDEHFTVDGTMVEAWANRRSFHPRKEIPQKGSGYGGQKLLRDTHESKTDPEARLFKRSAAGEIKPSYLGHLITENRNGLVMDACVTESSTRGEREAALAMIEHRKLGRAGTTLGADKAYQEKVFLERLRVLGIVPHVAEYREQKYWPNALRSEERDDPGFGISQRKRKLVEKVFGWIKSIAGLKKTKLRGRKRVQWLFQLAAAAYNVLRLSKLLNEAVVA